MKTRISFLISLFCLSIILTAFAQQKEPQKLQNPVTVEYLKKNLRKSQPRLVINSDLEKLVKTKLKTDPVIQNMYKAIQANAAAIQGKPLLERKL